MTTMTAMTAKRYETTWPRPEFADVPEQLMDAGDIARMAGVERRRVLKWAEAYDDFPQPVKEVRTGPGLTRYYLAGEVAVWLRTQRPSLVEGMPEEQRMRQLLLSYQEDIRAQQAVLDRLRAQQDAVMAVLR